MFPYIVKAENDGLYEYLVVAENIDDAKNQVLGSYWHLSEENITEVNLVKNRMIIEVSGLF